VTDAEWEARRKRAIFAAFQTGRPVFADSDGEMRFADGDHERLAEGAGMPKTAVPQQATVSSTWRSRVKSWFGGRS